jgi:peptide/nickel transport system ATP-binding protein
MTRLREQSSLMLITHNLGVVAETCSTVVVMYAGQIMERGSSIEIFKHPMHPYTQGLLKAIPTLSTTAQELYSIPGVVPRVQDFSSGCRYAPRCPHAMPRCREKAPQQTAVNANHMVACYLEGSGN